MIGPLLLGIALGVCMSPLVLIAAAAIGGYLPRSGRPEEPPHVALSRLSSASPPPRLAGDTHGAGRASPPARRPAPLDLHQQLTWSGR